MEIKRIAQLIFAGNSVFTIKNKNTGNHFTFKVKKPNKGPAYVWHVSVLGPYQNWLYMFAIRNGRYHFSYQNSRMTSDDVRVKAIMWFLNTLNKQVLPEKLILEFSDTCCRCGRQLTDVDSINLKIGPECRKYIETER